MEKRTIYRITGILAVVGLAVVLLPLFMDNEEAPALSPSIVQAPAFPDQAITDPQQISENPEPQAVLPVGQAVQTPTQAQTDTVEKTPEAANVPMTADSNNVVATVHNTPEANIPEAKPGIVNVNNPAPAAEPEAPAPKKREAEVIKKPEAKKVATVKKVAEKKPSPIKVVKQKLTPIQSLTPETDQGLLGLKKSAWVIQIGSFKSKSNAIKMANHLRANGYNAFMQDMTSSFGPSTRVFIGPEYKQSSATALVKQLEAELHLHGIVVSYNPLVL